MVNEGSQKPLTNLDELPTASGFTAEEINKTLEENKIVEQHIIWAEYLGDALTENKNCVNLDILLPNGLLLPTLCPLDNTLIMLKQTVYRHMRKLPLSSNIENVSKYMFFVVSDDGEFLELFDEDRTLHAVPMFLPVLALKEAKDNEQSNKLTTDISLLLGNDLEKIEKALTEELRNFRIELFNNACQSAEQERGTDGILHYEFPEETILPNVGDRNFSPNSHFEVHEEDIEFWWFPNLPTDAREQAMQRLKKKVERSKNGLEVWYSPGDNSEYTEFIGIKDIFEKTPSDIITYTLRELDKKHEKPADFILQVAGKRTFITRNITVIRYEYIRSCFENYRQPIVLMRRKRSVFDEFAKPPTMFEPYYIRANNFCKRFPCTEPLEPRCFWDLDDNMRVQIKSVSNMEMSNALQIYLRIAVAVGRHVLDVRDSPKVWPTNPRWSGDESQIDFDIYMKDLPESSQISISLIQIVNGKIGPEEHAVAFINMRLFDWRNRFIQGKHTFYLWPFPADSDDLMNLLGIQGQNYNTKTVRIELEIYDDSVVRDAEFPDWPMIEKYADFVDSTINSKKSSVRMESITRSSAIFARILRLKNELDGAKISIEDQKFLWEIRFKIQELFPQMVLILADCPIIYRERETLCEFYTLLNDWPPLYVDTALELLDVRFPDRYVRAFAVRHLDKCLDSDQFLIYLLPLVQTLKYEAFDTSPLADMLVRRALMDYRIGHTFFWLLCSELTMFKPEEIENLEKAPKMYLRLCLMFEAYCRGNSCHLESMIKQKEMVNTLTDLSKLIKTCNIKDQATKRLRSELSKMKDRMQNMHSPLNPCCRLGELIVDECRVLSSAKMPLKLRWTNPEPMCNLNNPFHEIIFKNGDDLRQDLLTLQVMRIFDAKWKNYNQDYCLTLYEVLPMGQNIGMIHVVQNCHTIFQIQCFAKQITSNIGIDAKLLNRFIYNVCTKDKELNSKMYMECVDRFSYSLAGYCIATYVLGIKDRHQDNLMVVEDGRIFHIDFGHILGHAKMKFGLNRERTDFVLTDHFLCVISHGKEDIRDTFMYKNFRDSCLQGFLLLHYHRRFFIALFRMMRCMGLPELKKDEDVDYLYTSLMYDRTERKDVEAAFLEVFDNVVKSDISTNVNWFFHTVRHHL